MPLRIFVETFGCATTQGESAMMQGILRAAGHEIVGEEEDADAALVVTCTVVERTERTVRARLRDIAASGLPLIVSGCMATAQAGLLREEFPAARLLGPADIAHVAHVLDGRPVWDGAAPKTGLPRLRAVSVDTIVINDGCTGNCSFCITKLARPGLRSQDPDGIVADVARASEAGVAEIRLTSMDTAAYGLDRRTNLGRLVAAAARVPGNFMLRVGMMNPFALDPILPDVLAAYREERVFKFLHLPVQSGSDAVLARMGRHHAAADFERLVSAFRAEHPGMTVATDVIVGFPGETDEDFEATLRLVERVRPAVVNITRFSPRPGTRAAAMAQELHGRDVKARSRRLASLRTAIGEERHGAFMGRTVRAIVTEPGRCGTTMARTRDYVLVVVQGEHEPGAWLDVEVEEARFSHVLGTAMR